MPKNQEINFLHHFSHFSEKKRSPLNVPFFWLPCCLIVFFIVQNLLFNRWLEPAGGHTLELVLANLATGALLFAPGHFLRNNFIRYGYLILASTASSLIFVSEYFWFSYAGEFLPASAITYAGQASELSGAIKQLFDAKILFFALPLALIAFFGLFSRRPEPLPNAVKSGNKFLPAILTALIVSASLGYLVFQEKKESGDIGRLYGKISDPKTYVGKLGIVNFYFADLARFLWPAVEISQAKENLDAVKNEKGQTGGQKKYFGIASGKNLIFIQIESLKNWVINYRIDGKEVAPNLNGLAKRGLYLPYYFGQIGPGNTADAEFSALNSLYPVANSVAFINYAQNRYEALPQLLQSRGYGTYAMHTDDANFWNRSEIYPRLGYERAFTKKDFTASKKNGFQEISDEDFYSQAAEKIKTFPQPFFVSVMNAGTHTPFSTPAGAAAELPYDESLGKLQNQYLKAVNYADQSLGNFFGELEKSGLLEKSLVIIYGDHGNFLSDPESANAGMMRGLPRLQIHHVPLIVLDPSAELNGELDTPASHIDLYPTVANLLGIDNPYKTLGQDVFNTDAPVVTMRRMISGVVDFIYTPKKIYVALPDAVFEHGVCMEAPALTGLPIEDCRAIYESQAANIRASDGIIEGDLLRLLYAN